MSRILQTCRGSGLVKNSRTFWPRGTQPSKSSLSTSTTASTASSPAAHAAVPIRMTAHAMLRPQGHALHTTTATPSDKAPKSGAKHYHTTTHHHHLNSLRNANAHRLHTLQIAPTSSITATAKPRLSTGNSMTAFVLPFLAVMNGYACICVYNDLAGV